MSMHRKTITLTEQQDHWVKGQIKSGNFGNDSEYIRDLIRRDQQSQERIATLRQALKDGEASGAPRSLNMAAVKKAARAKSTVAE
ncbi:MULTISPECIES: type II toxin-antitoxin system ParD family antitoxin [unclassified Marinobacter]|uniref:type II toxin-antitoxin system ParD family antitoxin n=1 Tax=unclassified Marinobacter TaxID=83889 RepID=UPI000BF4FB86|nr:MULTISPECIES: type II toxin-antitoxin system ParD family antitoxin [unclassified Marinobacter]PFG11577.1 antitoxin ParD1/3/4 [Marinobacter sp. LV10MA510-1]PFG53395.1 antitoxin ParD1/3/4 [Marinobacter sp. LV10R520-4]